MIIFHSDFRLVRVGHRNFRNLKKILNTKYIKLKLIEKLVQASNSYLARESVLSLATIIQLSWFQTGSGGERDL